MNPSKLLTKIKMDLGIYGMALPFKDGDKSLYDVFTIKSIPTFSIYCPYVMKLNLNLNELTCLKSDYSESIYELPDVFGDKEILYVRKVSPRNRFAGSGNVSSIFDDSLDVYNQLMMTQANANLVSLATPALTFKFMEPRNLHIYNMSSVYGEIDIELAFEHADNMLTIPKTAAESFYELAILDIKMFLYNNLKLVSDIQTAYGTISLKIDEWSSAENDRRDLLERWKDLYHLDTEQFFII